ncbi:MAG: hypothetical protein LUC50_05140, partial [Ruminococcus sp.]|nr:hypothetical protein [Ruminococcus sp.]
AWSTSINYYMLSTKIDFRDNPLCELDKSQNLWYNSTIENHTEKEHLFEDAAQSKKRRFYRVQKGRFL